MSQAQAQRRRVLIVDDQPMLAKAIRRMLSAHDVTIVTGAREALTLIEAGHRYDVILSDLLMPELSGVDLHDRLADIAPEQVSKMIFMTGGAVTESTRAFFEQIENPRLEKPFDKAQLVAAIEGLPH